MARAPASTSTLAAAPSRRHPFDTRSGEIPLSHTVQIQTEVRDPAAVHAACRRLGLPEPANGTAQLYGGRVSGLPTIDRWGAGVAPRPRTAGDAPA